MYELLEPVVSAVQTAEWMMPDDVKLYQNYPNPFNPITAIKFSLPRSQPVQLKVYDISGKEIKTLIDSVVNHGEHRVELHANELANGIYLYRLMTNHEVFTKIFLLMK